MVRLSHERYAVKLPRRLAEACAMGVFKVQHAPPLTFEVVLSMPLDNLCLSSRVNARSR
jgi:hypothetical protein